MNFVGNGSLATHQDWLEAVSRVLGDNDFDEILVTELLGGLRINPLYTSSDGLNQSNIQGGDLVPDVGASRRSSNISGLLNGWDIRQRHWLTTPSQTNEAILTDLERGVNSIELITGQADEESISGILDGVLLDIATVAPIGTGDNVTTAKNFLASVDKRNIDKDQIRADLSCDPIGRYVTQGGIEGGITKSLSNVGTLATHVSKECGHVTTVRLDGSPYAQSGADSVTELSVMAATGVAYLRTLCDAGLEIEDAFDQILVVISVGTDQFLDIAKIRAFREMWRSIGESCGIEDVPVRIQASTSLSVISKAEPWVNLLRTTVGCFSSAIGGADIISVAPFDSGLGIPDDLGLRLARNTQLILMEEANIHRVIDPAGGSWYVESLTDQLSKSAWERFQAIEKNGGVLNEIQNGTLQSHLEKMRAEVQGKVQEGDQILVGVNQFTSDEERPLERSPYPKWGQDVDFQEVEPIQLFRPSEGLE